jgi:hypothetical protein
MTLFRFCFFLNMLNLFFFCLYYFKNEKNIKLSYVRLEVTLAFDDSGE